MDALKERVPVSDQAFIHARNLWIDSAVALLDEKMRALESSGRDEAIHLLKEAREKLDGEKSRTTHSQRKDPIRSLKEQPERLCMELSETFKRIGLPAHGVKEQLYQKRLDRLNNGQEWKVVRTRLLLNRNGTRCSFHSTISPAAQLGNVFTDSYGGRGVASASITEHRHAVNLCLSELRDEGGRILFKGLRHGVHSAYGLGSASARGRANWNRAMETVRAALVTHPRLLQRALNRETIELNMVSISLLTPDNVRPLYSKVSNEKKQLREQLEAWRRLNELGKRPEGIELEVQDPQRRLQKVRIRVEVLPFNFGVNEAAVVGKFGLSSKWNWVGGWGNVREMNAESMRQLLGDTTPGTPPGGRVGAFLGKQRSSMLEAHLILKLTDHIRTLWVTQAYMQMGNEPYKIVSRLALLAYLTDQITLWNCKSGKDRAGMMDVEIKFLAARTALTGDVPEPDMELSEEDKLVFREIALNSGNLEIQTLNTGIPGFKTEGVPAIDRRLGSPEARAVHRGGSRCVED